MSQAFYRKWRPQSWADVVGQDHVTQTLRNAITGGRVAHAYLFAGPRGTGKTTMARLLAKAVNCLYPDAAKRPCNLCDHCTAVNEGRFLDLIEIDAASNTSVEDVRDLRDKINFSPSQGTYKVYIIDEVHMLSTAAFNALLKTLEEPPPHAIFILATTEVHKIPPTVLSRCQRHEFRRIPLDEIRTRLEKIAKAEKISVNDAAITLIARQANGALRDAESLLDQLSSTGQKITLELAQNVLGTATSQVVIDIVDAILHQQAAEGLGHIHKALDAGADARSLARQVTDYLRSLLLVKLGNAGQLEATKDVRARMADHAQAFHTDHLLAVLRAFNAAAAETRSTWQPSLPLELAFTESLEMPKPAEDAPVHSAPSTPTTPGETPTTRSSKPAPPTRSQSSASTESTPGPDSIPPILTAETVSPSVEGSEVSFKAILQNWDRIRAAVKKQKKNTEALLNSGKPLGVKANLLVIGFASDMLKSKMEDNANIEMTCKAIAQVMGIQIGIRCIVSSGKGAKIPDDLEVEDGGIVATALGLGGEIVDIQKG